MESGGSIINLRVPMLSTAGALGLVLRFCVCDGLPLHIGFVVSSAALERLHVIDDVPWAWAAGFSSGRAGVLLLEGIFSCSAAFDSPVSIAHD